jgi:hypothetical protein
MFVVGDFDRDLWMYNMSVSKIEEVLGTNGVVIRILGALMSVDMGLCFMDDYGLIVERLDGIVQILVFVLYEERVVITKCRSHVI